MGNHVISFWPFSLGQVLKMAYFSKVCVSIFVFISGFGLMFSLKKKDLSGKEISKWISTRLVKLLAGYSFIVVLSWIICQLINGLTVQTYFHDKMIGRGLYYMLLDFLGVAKLFGTPMLNGTWWYMSIAVVFVILAPFLYKCIRKMGYIFTFSLVIILARSIGVATSQADMVYPYLVALLLGMLFADKELFTKLDTWFSGLKSIAVKILVFVGYIVSLVALFVLYNEIPYKVGHEMRWGVLTIAIISFVFLFILKSKIITTILGFLGYHARNIFLIHTFIRFTYLNDLTYSMKHAALVVLFLLAGSLVLSYFVEFMKWLVRLDKWQNKLLEKIS
jgi:peptidoglycan/LPS O-acetylase OafA/YrhL